jgi:hypothetical protein
MRKKGTLTYAQDAFSELEKGLILWQTCFEQNLLPRYSQSGLSDQSQAEELLSVVEQFCA